MHTLKQGGGRFVLFCLQVEWQGNPVLKKMQKSIGGKEAGEEGSHKSGLDNFNKLGSAFPLKCEYLSKIIEGEHQISSQARKQHSFQETKHFFVLCFF